MMVKGLHTQVVHYHSGSCSLELDQVSERRLVARHLDQGSLSRISPCEEPLSVVGSNVRFYYLLCGGTQCLKKKVLAKIFGERQNERTMAVNFR